MSYRMNRWELTELCEKFRFDKRGTILLCHYCQYGLKAPVSFIHRRCEGTVGL